MAAPPRPAHPAPAWVRYGVAVAAVGVAATLNLAVRRYVTAGTPLFGLPTAVAVAAVAGGFGAGLAATALAAVVGLSVLDAPAPPPDGPWSGWRLAVFLLEGAALSGAAAALGIDRTARDRAWPARYGAALVIVAAALGLNLFAFGSLSHPHPFTLLYAAVAVAAWAGGLGPALVATAVAAVAADWFWMRPRPPGPADHTARLLLFAAEGAAIALACGRLQPALAAARRRRDEEAAAARRSRQLLAAVRDYAVFQLDPDGRVAVWNAGAARIFGLAEADALGRPFADFATAVDREMGRAAAELREAAEAGRSERAGWRRRADGSRFWAESVVTAEADKAGFAVVVRDASARRQAEEAVRQSDEKLRQAQRLEAVGRLAGGIAHDFNNLLTVILGNLDLILEHGAAPELTRSLLEDVRAAGQRAAVLTRQLLSFSRREATAPRRVDVNAVVADMGAMLRRVIAEHITLATDLRPGVGPVLVDQGQLEQVVLNLVVNARDAMPKGGTLTLRTAEADVPAGELPADAEGPPGRYVVLTVADTGVGMDEATQARIFEPFFTTKEVGKGTGLGLATVYGNVKQARGWVAVDSRPGEGATFRVFLPRAAGAAEAAKPAAAGPRPTGSETVLLVEDEPALRDMAKRVLEGAGYMVLACPDGRAGMEASRRYSGPIDLLITDLVMPVVNGRQLAAALKQERSGLRVLFVSGYTESIVANLGGLEMGEELLDKPFVPDDLTRKVREMLDRPG